MGINKRSIMDTGLAAPDPTQKFCVQAGRGFVALGSKASKAAKGSGNYIVNNQREAYQCTLKTAESIADNLRRKGRKDIEVVQVTSDALMWAGRR
jgi:hypothetical protein